MKKITKIIWVIAIAIIILVSAIISSRSACNKFSVESCPNRCVVCPPCEVCSSISCQTEEFCKNIGFDRSWHEAIKERLKSRT